MKKEYQCYFELTIDLIGGKWKPLIIYHIGESQVLRYGELKQLIPSINERMLTKQLRELEKEALIHRKVYNQVPPKVEYTLTDIGKSVMPILLDMKEWGRRYNETLQAATVKNCPQT
jgi:DNA-binding HxlR family transcriptional regulator